MQSMLKILQEKIAFLFFNHTTGKICMNINPTLTNFRSLCNDISDVEKALEQGEEEPINSISFWLKENIVMNGKKVTVNMKYVEKRNIRLNRFKFVGSPATRIKQRKEPKKEQTKKKVKTYIVEEDEENPYDLDKVLEALGEVIKDFNLYDLERL